MLIYTTGCFIIGESASFTDLPTEMTEEERREQLRKPEKDRIKVSQEELDMVQYKKWWNKQVRGGGGRGECGIYKQWWNKQVWDWVGKVGEGVW